ncbi:unnamed protein product, partial [Mesorhabditis spiculigera]
MGLISSGAPFKEELAKALRNASSPSIPENVTVDFTYPSPLPTWSTRPAEPVTASKLVENLALVAIDVLFFICFILSSILFLRVFSLFSTFSSIIFSVKNTARDLFCVALIMAALWITYAASQYILMGDEPDSWPFQFFRNGAWETFGELEDTHKHGNHCVVPNSIWDYKYKDWQCASQGWLLPVIMFVYTLTASVVLINILTAVLSNEFEEVIKTEHWRCVWYKKMVEYEYKPVFPPPFTFLLIIGYIPMAVMLLCPSVGCVEAWDGFKRWMALCCVSPSTKSDDPSNPSKERAIKTRAYFCIEPEEEIPLTPVNNDAPAPPSLAKTKSQILREFEMLAWKEVKGRITATSLLIGRDSDRDLTLAYVKRSQEMRHCFLFLNKIAANYDEEFRSNAKDIPEGQEYHAWVISPQKIAGHWENDPDGQEVQEFEKADINERDGFWQLPYKKIRFRRAQPPAEHKITNVGEHKTKSSPPQGL